MNEDWRDEEITELGVLKNVIRAVETQQGTLETQGRTLDAVADFMDNVNRTHLGMLVAFICQWGVIIWLAVKVGSMAP